MAKKENGKSQADLEGEILSAIAAFEQIVEAMPNDRASLEALAHAYEQIGDHVKAKDYTIRLCNVVLDEPDIQAALELRDKLVQYAKEDTRAAEIVERIDGTSRQAAVVDTSGIGIAGQVEAAACNGLLKGFDMSDEMSFAWNLMEAKKIPEEDYSSIVQDLTEMSSGQNEGTVSVLHVLEARGSKNLDKIMTFVSKDCKTPFISLSGFDLQADTIMLLPPDVMMRRGVLVFDLIGKDALVVIMNPYNKKLQKDLSTALGRKCHFFACMPSEFDQALERVKEIVAEIKSREEDE